MVAKEVQVTVVVESAQRFSGESAVGDSVARSALRLAERAEDHQGVRFVNGKSFTFQQMVTTPDGRNEELWVDNSYRETISPQTILFGSDEYFELAKDHNTAQWLAVSPELLLVIDESAYRITSSAETDHDATPKATTSTPPTPVPATDTSPTFWESVLAWLGRLFAPAAQN